MTLFSPEATTEAIVEVWRVSKEPKGEKPRREMQEKVGLKNDEHFRKSYRVPALKAGFIEMTIPDKPNSPKQKYRVTEKGRKVRCP